MLQLIVTLSVLATDRVRRAGKDRGATAVEYGLIVALIAAVVIGLVVLLGNDIREAFDTVENRIGGDDGNGVN